VEKAATPCVKPIPQSLWENYRTELEELYKEMTLKDVIALMKARHGFIPS
jgi:hypothetical protein